MHFVVPLNYLHREGFQAPPLAAAGCCMCLWVPYLWDAGAAAISAKGPTMIAALETKGGVKATLRQGGQPGRQGMQGTAVSTMPGWHAASGSMQNSVAE
jgi:hypothetical protein